MPGGKGAFHRFRPSAASKGLAVSGLRPDNPNMPQDESQPRARGGWIGSGLVVIALALGAAVSRQPTARAAAPAPADTGRFGRGLKADATYAAAPHNPVYSVVPMTVECWAR